MRIISNPKKIQRNYKIGLYTSFAALIFLFGAVAITLIYANRPDLANLSFLAMALGLVLSQVGVYFANRWGKSPRVDERITASLKGLDDRYTLYHYTAAVPHLLLGPSGAWVLVAQYHPGTITYEKGRYRQKGVGFIARMIGQEGLGRPEIEAQGAMEDMQKFLQKSLPECPIPVEPVIVFTNVKATVQANEAPIPSMHVDKLKDFIRRKAKEQPVNMRDIEQVEELLPAQDVA